ncbi:MAG: right-handed parallel beta-helix repeat-containing protein, partial [Patescibacteria group bacterium]
VSSCGDGSCNGTETCSTCYRDCGSCDNPVPPPPSGSIAERLTLRLSESDQKFAERANLETIRQNLPFWNNGADYGPVLQSQINSGGTIVVPPGRYKFFSNVEIKKDGVTVHAEKSKTVFFEAEDPATKVLWMAEQNGATVENIVFWGKNKTDVTALSLKGSNLIIRGNFFMDFDKAFISFTGSEKMVQNITVSNNYFFGNGYHPLLLIGSRSDTDLTCLEHIENSVIENNFLDNNYQGIVLNCVSNSVVRNNIARNSSIAGFRLETSSNNLVENNLFHLNALNGMWIYAGSFNNRFLNNIIIDNGQQNQTFWFECWKAQQGIAENYLIGERYPYLREEKGQRLFLNYYCQFNGFEVEFRNTIIGSEFSENVIGRYSRAINKSLAGETTRDIRVNYFPFWYPLPDNPPRFSRNNNFHNNYFINSSNDRILDQGCGDRWSNNKLISFNPYLETNFPISYSEEPLCSVSCSGQSGCSPCNNNGVCEIRRGEYHSNCSKDCPCIPLGQKGERQNYDACCSGQKTERIYPATPGCVNHYTGTFYCTNCGNGSCDFGEDPCSCPVDCSACVPTNNNVEICDGLDNNCNGQADEGCLNQHVNWFGN